MTIEGNCPTKTIFQANGSPNTATYSVFLVNGSVDCDSAY
jgi:hypothetical protein